MRKEEAKEKPEWQVVSGEEVRTWVASKSTPLSKDTKQPTGRKRKVEEDDDDDAEVEAFYRNRRDKKEVLEVEKKEIEFKNEDVESRSGLRLIARPWAFLGYLSYLHVRASMSACISLEHFIFPPILTASGKCSLL